MKERLLKHITRSVNMPEFLSGLFVLLLFTAHLFVFGPKGYRNITQVKFISFLAVCGVYIISMLIWAIAGRRRAERLRSGSRLDLTELCIILYFLLTLISALTSEYLPETLIGIHRREGVLTVGIYCLVFLLMKRGSWAGKWSIYILAAAAAVFTLVCILQLFKVNVFWLFPDGLTYYDAGEKYSGEFLGTMGNAGFTAAFLCICAPILLVYIARAREKARLWLLIPLLMSVFVLLVSRIAAGILGFFAGLYLALPFIFAKGRARRVWLAAELLIAAAALAVVYTADFESGILYELHSVLHGNFEDSFGTGRIFIWRHTLPLIAERPLLGGGPDTLAERIGVIFETVKEDGTVKQAIIDAAHNEYLNIAVCQGVIALAAYLTALIATLVRFIKRGTSDPVAAALAAGYICYSIQAVFGISMYIAAPYFWIIWALLERRLRYIDEEVKKETTA